MVKIIAIGGEPGAGKSTLMKKIMKDHDIVTLKEDGKFYGNSERTIIETKQGISWNVKNPVEEILELLNQK